MRATLLLLVAILPAACALIEPTYVYVDSIASDRSGPHETYFLFSGRAGLATDSRQFRRYSDAADEALQAAGLRKVDAAGEADIVVGFVYGVDAVRGRGVTRRTSFVEFAAYDWEKVRDRGDRNAIWRTRAYMDGSHGGFSRIVPMLVEASRPWLGKSTGGIVEVEFD